MNTTGNPAATHQKTCQPPPCVPSDESNDRNGQPAHSSGNHNEKGNSETGSYRIIEDRLASLRLGVASSLFQTLRLKHPPTASHALRVAIVCSAWAKQAALNASDRESLEIAALLHDLGKIGIPDPLLQLRNAPTNQQWEAIEQHWAMGAQIAMSLCGARSPVHEQIAAAGSWFDGSHTLLEQVGKDAPIGGRLIAIVDTYDTLVSRDLWPSNIDPQEAVTRLRSLGGYRLDPDLTETFIELQASNQLEFHHATQRWLTQLLPACANQYWQMREQVVRDDSSMAAEALFYRQMLEHTDNGILFVTVDGTVEQWNGGAERLTGIAHERVVSKPWDPTLIGLRHEDGQFVHFENCPVLAAIRSGTSSNRRMHLRSRKGPPAAIDMQIFPVRNDWGTIFGVIVNLEDASLENDLEQQVETLHAIATTDPLTGTANRGEFDRVLLETLDESGQSGRTCSLVICDIDHFKAVNDEHGHQAGDEALVSFATILQDSRRDGDMVGRYGGEEFVVVCKNCNGREAFAFAERMRIACSKTPLKELGGRYITASFGVSQSREEDRAEDLLRRADLALLKAKETGRNRVVAAESSDPLPPESTASTPKSWWPAWRTKPDPLDQEHRVQRYLATNVPVNVAAEKLRGFVAEYQAVVVETTDQRVVLEMDAFATDAKTTPTRRLSDHPFQVQVELAFGGIDMSPPPGGRRAVTVIHVTVTPFHASTPQIDPIEVGRRVIHNLRLYLMAHDYDSELVKTNSKNDLQHAHV